MHLRAGKASHPATGGGQACGRACRWLGRPGLDHGASADLLCYSQDPRSGSAVLSRPDLVILRGKAFRPTG